METALETLVKIFYAVVAFGILIFFHELGHFLMAKLMGVKVLTFALGFATKLLKVRVGETEYAICAVPLGGYVKMLGEDQEEEIPSEDLQRAFSSQKVWKRFMIVFAGPAFNLLLAVAIVSSLHLGEIPYLPARIQEVVEASPAAEAGLMPGDEILEVGGRPIKRFQELRELIFESEGAPLQLSVMREGSRLTLTVIPRLKVELSPYGDEIRIWQIGVVPVGEIRFENFGPLDALAQGLVWTWDKSWFTVRTLARLVTGRESIKNIGSPLLIGAEAAKQAEHGPASYFSFIAFVSVILAVMNLLPIPVLDGSHLLFFLVEAITRRPLSRRFLGAAQYVGIAILVCIMAWALYRDLDRFYWKAKQTEKPAPVEEVLEPPQGDSQP
ncbi:MAG: RIP metalloprotease RseP [bacterium]